MVFPKLGGQFVVYNPVVSYPVCWLYELIVKFRGECSELLELRCLPEVLFQAGRQVSPLPLFREGSCSSVPLHLLHVVDLVLLCILN